MFLSYDDTFFIKVTKRLKKYFYKKVVTSKVIGASYLLHGHQRAHNYQSNY